MSMPNVVEIFDSIDGEGIRAGRLATFVRLAGCNLRCSYCDTPYALNTSDGRPLAEDEVVRAVALAGNRLVTLTGGEPLATQGGRALALRLLREGFEVNIETNGSMPFDEFLPFENAVITMDWKTPSSGCSAAMRGLEAALRPCDVLKIVMARSDEDAVADFLSGPGAACRAPIFLSPVFGAMEPARLVEFLKELRGRGIRTEGLRMQLQLHKFIWNPEERGV